MSGYLNKVFLITEGLKGEIKRDCFLMKDNFQAIAYFENYIKNERKYFTLRIIAIFTNNGEIKHTNLYVKSIDNTKLKETPKELKEKYEKASYLKNKEAIQLLFSGEEIK